MELPRLPKVISDCDPKVKGEQIAGKGAELTRIMRDSTTPTDIPVHGTELAAGYATGKFKWSAKGYARFPGIPHVHIDCLGTSPEKAEILDVEPGCAGVQTAATWAKKRKAAFPDGYPPIIYCDRNTLTSLRTAMNAAGLRIVRDFRLWVATLDGTKRIDDMTGVTAVQHKHARKQKPNGQWAEQPGKSATTGHYDESIVYDDNWHPEDDLPYTKNAVIGLVKKGVAEELLAGDTREEILNLVKRGVAAELGAGNTREEILNLVKQGVAAELGAVHAQEALSGLARQLTDLTILVNKALPPTR